MFEKTIDLRDYNITMKAFLIGSDLIAVISGGDTPHVGSVVLSTPRVSLKDKNKISATSSIINRVGHKEGRLSEDIGDKLASSLNTNVAVVCGIHYDDADLELLEEILREVDGLVNEVIEYYKQ